MDNWKWARFIQRHHVFNKLHDGNQSFAILLNKMLFWSVYSIVRRQAAFLVKGLPSVIFICYENLLAADSKALMSSSIHFILDLCCIKESSIGGLKVGSCIENIQDVTTWALFDSDFRFNCWCHDIDIVVIWLESFHCIGMQRIRWFVYCDEITRCRIQISLK